MYIQYISDNNWCGKINNIFKKLELDDYFISGQEVDLDIIKEKLSDLMHTEWLGQIPLKPKLWPYALFKSEFCPGSYVTEFLPKYKRSLLAQLRTGIVPLSIETGRY